MEVVVTKFSPTMEGDSGRAKDVKLQQETMHEGEQDICPRFASSFIFNFTQAIKKKKGQKGP